MEWWSETIMGGDPALDEADALLGALGVEFDFYDIEDSTSNQQILQSKLKDFEIRDYNFNQFGEETIGFQVLGVLYLASGTEIPPDAKSAIIDAIKEDDIAFDDSELRQKHLDFFLYSIENFENKPVFLEEEGLLECFQKHNSK